MIPTHISRTLNAEEITNLNAQWQNTVAKNVGVDSTDCGDETEYGKTQKVAYPFGETIAKIQSLQAEGKKICLFIGRSPFEELPSDHGEAKENEVWISADILLISSEGRSKNLNGEQLHLENYQTMKNPLDINRRLHLWLDFNQQEGLQLVQGLFDKVVIDNSTAHIFKDNFTQRFSILLHAPESEIIFQNTAMSSLQFDTQNDFTFDTFRNNLVTSYSTATSMWNALQKEEKEPWCTMQKEEWNALQKTWNALQKTMGKNLDFYEHLDDHGLCLDEHNKVRWSDLSARSRWLNEQARVLYKQHLETIYSQVTEYKDKEYPYKTNSSDDTSRYFIVSHPKSQKK
jgi:hypothetical protein